MQLGGAVTQPTVFIGFDSREPVASHVAAHSILKRTCTKPSIKYLKHRELRQKGYFARPWMTHGTSGEIIDLIDSKPFSTEFSHTRFLIPRLMNYRGWALFMDADMVFLSDIKELFALCDERYAVMCVKHNYTPDVTKLKMDGRFNPRYARKNWSSFVLWNCAHQLNRQITPEKINFMSGADMHSFSWLTDDLIGALPTTYNFISGVSPKLPPAPERGNMPHVIHYTDGGPWFDECQDVPYAQTWIDEYEDWQRNGETRNKVTEIESTRYE